MVLWSELLLFHLLIHSCIDSSTHKFMYSCSHSSTPNSFSKSLLRKATSHCASCEDTQVNKNHFLILEDSQFCKEECLIPLSLLLSTLLAHCTLRESASLSSHFVSRHGMPTRFGFVCVPTPLSLWIILNPKVSLSQSNSIAGSLIMLSHVI